VYATKMEKLTVVFDPVNVLLYYPFNLLFVALK
jgi:hypothetical protein